MHLSKHAKTVRMSVNIIMPLFCTANSVWSYALGDRGCKMLQNTFMLFLLFFFFTEVTHTYITEVGNHCFRYWLLVCKVLSHNQNQCQFIVRSQSVTASGIWIKIQKVCCENTFKNVCKMLVILFSPYCVNECSIFQSETICPYKSYVMLC